MMTFTLNPWFWRTIVIVIGVLFYVARLMGPSDLESNAQVLNVGYISDLVWGHGNWLVQYDLEHDIMSKPPLHTWLITPFALLLGVNRLALTLPSLVCVLALGLLVFEFAYRQLSLRIAALSALAFMIAAPSTKFVALVRADPPFVLATTAAAFAAFWAWEHGRGWVAFWVACAVGTLAKGPLILLLAAGGLLAVLWERRTNSDSRPLQGSHALGITLFFALCGGWFVAAWWSEGSALIDKMFFKELIGHSVGGVGKGRTWGHIVQPTLFLLLRYLPFSIFAALGIYRVLRSPAANDSERRLERFLVCWIVVGLIIFTIAKHQRADLVWPMWPPAAILAGREIARRFSHWSGKTHYLAASSAAICVLTIVLAIRATLPETRGQYAREEQLASAAEQAAEEIKTAGLEVSKLYHVRSPLTLQMHLGTFRQWTSPEALERLLETSTTPIDVVFGSAGPSELKLGNSTAAPNLLLRWPHDVSKPAVVQVFRFSPNTTQDAH